MYTKSTYKNRANWPLRISAVLICLLLITTHLLSGMYARYITTDSFNDGSRVAIFEVTSDMLDKNGNNVVSKTFKFPVNPYTDGINGKSFKIDAVNKSETAVRCIVSMDNRTCNIPLTLTVDGTENNGEYDLPTASESDPKKHTFTLTAKWDDNTSEDNFMYSGMVDHIVVTVRFEQID